MRHIYLTLGGCMAITLLGIGLWLMYNRAEQDLALPGAIDVQFHGPLSARQQQISYRLPPNRSLNDVYEHLENNGWSRDRRAEDMTRHDTLGHNDSLGSLTRQRLLGALSEIALVKLSHTDRRTVELRIIRCFRVTPRLGCL
jgi:hypothetical protein